MDNRLKEILDNIGEIYTKRISPESRHYIVVNFGKHAQEMGYNDLREKLKDSYAIIPLKEPIPQMKVRIDGRTFVDNCLHPDGFAVPGYVVKEARMPCSKYTANDSMILNCT
ncbi:MAG: hypothetical protein MUP22_13295 [Desulfobacterales bacterium]|nr:hypothetical protein [Desulfobacterales bacterium]